MEWGTWRAHEGRKRRRSRTGNGVELGMADGGGVVGRDENRTEIFRIDRFRFLYYEPFFNMKNCQFQLVSQPFSTIFCTL
jgi:hypothetical protein